MRSRPLAAALAIAVTGLAVLLPTGGADAATTTRAPARIAVVMPLSLPISTGTFVPSDALAAATAPDGVLTQQLDAVVDTGITLAIDPMLIASVRVLGNGAPATATAWLARLDEATNPTFALSYADADITAPLQAGARHVLQPGDLTYSLDPTKFSATSTPDPTSTIPPDQSAAPPLPDTAALLQWDYTETGVAWPRADTVTGKELVSISASGYSTTLLASKNLSRSDTTSATATIGSRHVVATDEVVSGLADRALQALDDAGWSAASAALSSAIAAYPDGASAVLTLDRSTTVDPARLGDLVSLVSTVGRTSLVPLADIAGDTSSSAKLVSRPQSAARVDTVHDLLAAEARVRSFAAVAADPTLVTGERRASLLVALSAGADASSGGFAGVAQQYLDDSDTLLNAVRVQQGSTITLLADRASIYVSVTNDLDQPATVRVSVRPLAPLLSVAQDDVELTVKAHSQGKASIPVQYISNGTVTLLVSLRSDAGTRIGTPLAVTANVRAGWEGPVTFGLAGLLLAVFAFGLVRTILRRRRRRAAEADAG